MKKKVQEEKTCECCGKKYIPSRKDQKYCSKKCQQKVNYERSKNRVYEYTCLYCGKKFSRKTRLKEIFCCDKCQEDYNYKNRLDELNEDLNKNLNKTPVAKITIWEIVNLKVKKYITPLQEGDEIFGKELNVWNLSDIPENTRNSVLQRDNNECQICQKKTDLHIHHIRKRVNGGNHSPSNLVTLCNSCHRYIETGDEELATQGCLKNALKYYGMDEKEPAITFAEIYKALSDMYIKCKNNEKEEVLYKISTMLDKLEEICI